MSLNTIEANKQMNLFDGQHSVWVFGYGSLIYKADFPYLERRPARISGWARRFWQGSHDHRGTPDAPGRVLTLARAPGATCVGAAYLVTPGVFDALDHREKNGYLRLATTITFDGALDDTSGGALDDGGSDGSNSDGSDSDGSDSVVGLVYIATPDNTAFLGEASEQEIARHIARSAGPSGPNSDYLNHLAHALRELGRHDQHVFEIERHLAALNTPPSVAPTE
jgi:cation transport regulator ChaC